MTALRHPFMAAFGLIGALTLGGCYDDGYGYGGVSVGTGYYGNGGYYGDGYYGPYGGSGYYGGGYGWYDGYYYPGNGYYVYDRGGRRYRWNDGQRRYWESRRSDRRDDRRDGRRDDRRDGWQNRDGDGNRWNGQDGQQRRRYYQQRPADANGVTRDDASRGNRWNGGAATRPVPQQGMREPQQQAPRMSQPRVDRGGDMGRPMRADRPTRSWGGGRDRGSRARPD